ncbi:MAG: Uma2 family endonuclease [Leptospira sp.]|nr:Uma2 family endonuclease [Leptospira sp.]
MSAVLEKISISDYLERERNSMERAEYIQGEERKMTGARYNHNCIVINLIKKISDKLDNQKWRILCTDQKIWIPAKEAFYYTDVLILPTPPRF